MTTPPPRKHIHRIVIKVGTALIDDPVNHFNWSVVREHARQIAALMGQGRQVILVSSGAVGAGMRIMGRQRRPKPIRQRQALAAIGQSLLMQWYHDVYEPLGIRPAQVLLTRLGLNLREGYINAERCLETLLTWNLLPIINENDTVAIDELRFGDNDHLAALVAAKLRANLLIILTNVEGLLDGDGQLVPIVERLSPELEAIAGGRGSETSSGGMFSKVRSARSATAAGVPTVIASGHRYNNILDIVTQACRFAEDPATRDLHPGTWFLPGGKPLAGRKRWIAFSRPSDMGAILVDAGAVEPLVSGGKSLLPSGVHEIRGQFRPGDIVQVCRPDGFPFAQGLVNYTHEELDLIKRQATDQAKSKLPPRTNWEVIHRDDLVLL